MPLKMDAATACTLAAADRDWNQSSSPTFVIAARMAVGQESTSFIELSRGLARRIDEALARYTAYGPDCPTALADAIRHSLLAPGKRLRPMLVLMAARACGCDWWAA